MKPDPTVGAQFVSIRSDSIVTEVHRQIREQLLSGALAPGEPLRESVLAEKMGVSRSPVREALRLLEQSGLVRKMHNRSYAVSQFAVSDIPELLALRLADETLAIRLLIRNKTPLTKAAEVLEQMRSAHLRRDSEAVASADVLFHTTIVQLSGFPRLMERYANLRDQIRFLIAATGISLGQAGEGQVERHERLLQALSDAQQDGDPSTVLALWEEHILLGMREPGSPDPIPAR